MFTTTRIKSHCSSAIYAEQNEELEVISINGHVAIVEGKSGRFPCLVELLADERVVVEEVKVLKEQLELW